LWDVTTGKELRRFEGHGTGLTGAVFSRDGRRALSTGGSMVCLWDVASGEKLHCFQAPGSVLHRAAFLKDEQLLVTGGDDGTFRVWRLPSVPGTAPS